jgi:hypothetical protein
MNKEIKKITIEELRNGLHEEIKIDKKLTKVDRTILFIFKSIFTLLKIVAFISLSAVMTILISTYPNFLIYLTIFSFFLCAISLTRLYIMTKLI